MRLILSTLLFLISCTKYSPTPTDLAYSSKIVTNVFDGKSSSSCMDKDKARNYLTKIWPLYEEKRAEIEKVSMEKKDIIAYGKNFCESEMKKFLD